jgi:glycosyltransferase involved in cell wall biosynthesis
MAAFGGTSLLEYCLERLERSLTWPLVVVSPTGSAAQLGRVAGSGKIRLCAVPSERAPQGLAQAAAVVGASRMLLLHGLFGLDLVPVAFLEALVAEHASGRCDATIATGLPAPLYAVVCEQSILDLFSSIPPASPVLQDPAQVLELVVAAGKPASGAELVIRRKSFAHVPHAEVSRLPRLIPWSTPGDLQLLEQVLRAPQTSHPLGRLALLRELLLERLEVVHRSQARRVRRQGRSKPPRVLYASNPSAYSGAEQSLVRSVRALRVRGWEVHALVALEGLFTSRLREAGAVVHCPGRDFAQPSAANLIQLDQLLEAVRPDLIHANAVVGTPLTGLARIRGIPFVQWVRVAHADALEEQLMCADRITAVSRFVAARLSQYMIRPEKIRVLYDCVDVSPLSPHSQAGRDARRELGAAGEEFVVLCLARFTPYKRHDLLLRAMALVRERHRRIRLWLVGETDPGQEEYYCRCMDLLRELRLSEVTSVVGFRENILDVELAADAIVQASDGEPLGTAVLEAMALGRPVIVAASGGLPELVEHGRTGLHFQPGNAHSLTEQICAVIEDRGMAERLGKSAQAAVAEWFSPEAHVKNLLAVYDEVLDGVLCQR